MLHLEILGATCVTSYIKKNCLKGVKYIKLFTAKGEFDSTKKLEFLNCPTKPKGVTAQMKALDEYILMVLFVLSLKRVHFLV